MRILLILLLPLYSSCQTSSNSASRLFLIKEYGKCGYIDPQGKTVINCRFDAAGEFSEGLAPVLIDTLWGFIDTTGRMVIKPAFYRVSYFSDGLCNVTLDRGKRNANAFINADGSVAFISKFDEVSAFASGRATVTIKDQVHVIDRKGKIVFNTHFPYGAGAFEDGVLKVWKGDLTRYYDTTGKVLLEFKGMGYGDFKNGLALINPNDTPIYINKKGQPIIKPENPKLLYFDFSDGFAQAIEPATPHRWFIDTTGRIVLTIPFGEVRDFHEGLAPVYDDDLGWGFIDKKGNVVIKPQFTAIDYTGFNSGICKAKQDHQWGFIDHTGHFVWREQAGIPYTKLDLCKWNLDTMGTNEPLLSFRYAGQDNVPASLASSSSDQFSLTVDTSDLTVFEDKYYAHKLYMSNASADTISIPAQDGYIRIIHQAKNAKGEWTDIENFVNSFCGNSYHTLKLPPHKYQIFPVAIFKGSFTTQLRFKLDLADKTVYSNIYIGNISPGQFLDPKNKDHTGVIVRTY